jgi:hypothetical protein
MNFLSINTTKILVGNEIQWKLLSTVSHFTTVSSFGTIPDLMLEES